MIYGSRVSLSVALLVIVITSTIGTALGILGGYLGGWLDSVLMRITDISLAFPGILIALLLAVTLGPSFTTVVLAISLLGWAPYARLIRGEVLKLREADFVLQARIIGCSPARIMLTHIFPEHRQPAADPGHAVPGRGHPDRIGAQLPGRRHPAAHSRAGGRWSRMAAA